MRLSRNGRSQNLRRATSPTLTLYGVKKGGFVFLAPTHKPQRESQSGMFPFRAPDFSTQPGRATRHGGFSTVFVVSRRCVERFKHHRRSAASPLNHEFTGKAFVANTACNSRSHARPMFTQRKPQVQKDFSVLPRFH